MLISLFFFKIWESGKYFKVAVISILIRLILIPIFEIYGNKIMAAEIPELLQWYKVWYDNNTGNDGFIDIMLNSLAIEGGRGTYLYYTMYAGWFINWTEASDMIPLRIFTATLSLYIIVFSKYLIQWLYERLPDPQDVLIILNWPFWVLYSVSLGRTMPSVLIPLFGILALHKIMEKFTFSDLAFVIATFLITTILRTFYSFFYFSTLIAFIIYKVFLKDKYKIKVFQKIGILLLMLFSINILANQFNIQDAFSLIIDNLTQSDQVEGDASGSSYLTSLYPQKYTDLIFYMPIQGIYFFLSPMVWDVSKAEQLISCLFALLLLYFVLKMLFNKDNYYHSSSKAKIFMLNMMIICMILGAGVKNAGAAQRWRLPITSIILCVTLPNLINPKKRL